MKQNNGKSQLRKKGDQIIFPDYFLTQTFLDAWDEFMIVRKQLKKGKDSDYAQGLVLDKIMEYSNCIHDVAVKLIQQSIESRWISIFPLKVIEQKKKMQSSVYQNPMKQKEKIPEWKPMVISPEQEIKMQEEAYNELEKIISEAKKLPISYPYVQVFNHMKKIGLISYTKNEGLKLKGDVITRLQFELKALREKNSSSTPIWERILGTPESIKNECRKQMVIDFFCKKYNLKGEENV